MIAIVSRNEHNNFMERVPWQVTTGQLKEEMIVNSTIRFLRVRHDLPRIATLFLSASSPRHYCCYRSNAHHDQTR